MTLFSDRDERIIENLRIINTRFPRKPKKLPVRGERPAFALGGSAPTLVVAASGSSGSTMARADYICLGTDDHLTIQTALSQLWAGGGGRLLLTEGTFTFGGSVVLTDSVRFEGMGVAATRLELAASADYNMFQMTVPAAPFSVEYSNLAMNGNKALQSATVAAINCPNSSENYLRIENCHIYDFEGYGVFWDRAAGQFFCSGSHIFGNTEDGLHLFFEGFYKVTGCDIFSNGGWGIKADAAANLIVSDNRISQNGSGGFSAGGVFQAPGVVLTGNRVWGNTGPGIQLNGGGDLIAGNWCFDNTGTGIWCTGANEPSGVVGNFSYGNGATGIYLDGSVGGNCSGNTVFENGHYGIVADGKWTVGPNRVEDNGRATNNTYDGILVTTLGDTSEILGNSIRQDGAANKQRYAINVAAGATAVKVRGNTHVGTFGTGLLNDAGTGTVTVWAGTAGDNF